MADYESVSKTVLLAYLKSKKKIIIPGDSSKSDLDYLREEFLTSFKCDANVSLTFQRFNPEWNEFVDLDNGDVLVHKDKLKAIVTPILLQQTTTPREILSEVTNTFFSSFPFIHFLNCLRTCVAIAACILLHLECYL